MNYTQSIGNLNELKCISRFIELGYECSIPYGNGAKYDFIVDVNGELLKIQCKSCSHPRRNGIVDNDAIQISTVSQTTNTKKTTRHTYSNQEIDYFATSYNNKIYIIPVDECSTNKTLRFKAPLNNSQYNKAEDYEIEKRFFPSNDLISSKEEFELRMDNIKKEKENFFCAKCGKKIQGRGKTGLCFECHAFSTRKCNRTTREELKKMIRTMPFTQIAKKYNVTDNAIRKWCDAEGLPRKVNEIKTYTEEEWNKV